MKIVVELVRVRQEYDPDTDTHINSVIFSFGGIVTEVAATPDQVREIITEARLQRGTSEVPSGTAPMGLATAAEGSMLAEYGADKEFGGDFEPDPDQPVRTAPELFTPSVPAVPPPTATMQRKATIEAKRGQDPAEQRKKTTAAMRARAKALPVRKTEKDDMGYPVIHKNTGAGSVAAPEIVVREPAAPPPGDDDGFEQG